MTNETNENNVLHGRFFDPAKFWNENEDYFTSPGEATDERIAEVEALLGYKLPADYIALLRLRNGGTPVNTRFPMDVATAWSENHIAIDGICGVGGTWGLDSEDFGSRFMIEEWGYPDIGVVFGECPSGGHDAIMLDYRECGPQGEPKVIHVEVETEEEPWITPVADSFGEFVRGLVHESVYDTSAEDKISDLKMARSAPLTPLLRRLCDEAGAVLPGAEGIVRKLSETIVEEKGYFALHADPLSYLMYDLQFLLYVNAEGPSDRTAYLAAYEGIMTFGPDGTLNIGGYAPGFVSAWLDARIREEAIVEAGGKLSCSEEHKRKIAEEAGAYRS
ncbi:SMI1/KNR4 family protein [Saccharibacillus alkalitolerans]|uniref:SMI1/KNR4 family protein n=1 Tax=Saccharibacillus alkalitolerans TaxID=2705290 RepID=A0ABX0F7B9_9BACL|nr:SMI1/KNR4 family protein [Saccharibacillus alkalitolerans]NGZ76712.1 SMI1/KNR4 family protein [Saccharibacillus alkalitolerans]